MIDSMKDTRKPKMTIEKLARITANGFADIRRELATKASKTDLKGFVTKKDSKSFATKEDLKGFATKEDLKRFATKEDLKGFATKEDIERLEERILIKTIESNDKLVTKLDTFLKEEAAHQVAHRRMQDTIDGHEVRIRKIEHTATSDK